jgi:hypothetical protein
MGSPNNTVLANMPFSPFGGSGAGGGGGGAFVPLAGTAPASPITGAFVVDATTGAWSLGNDPVTWRMATNDTGIFRFDVQSQFHVNSLVSGQDVINVDHTNGAFIRPHNVASALYLGTTGEAILRSGGGAGQINWTLNGSSLIGADNVAGFNFFRYVRGAETQLRSSNGNGLDVRNTDVYLYALNGYLLFNSQQNPRYNVPTSLVPPANGTIPVPANCDGFELVVINGVERKRPYWNA